MNTLMAIRAGLRAIMALSGVALLLMGAGITDLAPTADLGSAVTLMVCTALVFASTWYAHGVIDAMYHAELNRQFFKGN